MCHTCTNKYKCKTTCKNHTKSMVKEYVQYQKRYSFNHMIVFIAFDQIFQTFTCFNDSDVETFWCKDQKMLVCRLH